MADEQRMKVIIYEPLDPETAASIIGEGLHTGLRKGTEAPEAHALWQAIQDSDTAWPEALAYLVDGLATMNIALCEKKEVPFP